MDNLKNVILLVCVLTPIALWLWAVLACLFDKNAGVQDRAIAKFLGSFFKGC